MGLISTAAPSTSTSQVSTSGVGQVTRGVREEQWYSSLNYTMDQHMEVENWSPWKTAIVTIM